MAYNVYIACENCGRDMHLSCNGTYSMTKAIKAAKRNSWKVVRKGEIRYTDFFCPECAKMEKGKNDSEEEE